MNRCTDWLRHLYNWAIPQGLVASNPRLPGFRRKNNPMNPRWYYSKRFKPACIKAGVPVEKVGQCWHAARHAFGTRLGALLYKEATIMAMGGWTDSAAARRYIHPYEPVLREAAERLATLKPEKKVDRESA